jgi:hypothetical protein
VTFRAVPAFALINTGELKKRKRPLFRAFSLGVLRFEDVRLLGYFFFAGAFFFAFEAVFFAGAFLTTFFVAAAIEASYLSE